MDHIEKLKQFGFLRIGVFSGGEDLIAFKQEGNSRQHQYSRDAASYGYGD
ncbi:MAG: hypothetical protein Q8K61_10515 [Gallionella sp.]|nr:hypothetical protein [Gallionella sp.]